MLANSRLTDFCAELPTPASELSLSRPSFESVTIVIGICHPDSFTPAPLAMGPHNTSAIWSRTPWATSTASPTEITSAA
eukprot:7677091-Pyramimonas_sp.AAC.1